MKSKLLLGLLLSSMLLFSCDSNSTTGNDDTSSSSSGENAFDTIFQLSSDDIREEQLELEKKFEMLKNSDMERKAHDYDKFKPEIEAIETSIDSLRNYVSEFENAQSQDDQKAIYKKYKFAWEEVNEEIQEITKRFDDHKVMEY
ncbi:hypothetical protein [Algoriphagus sp.]|uniref:hypothetical protein n=1 Tax=Algoriphagus sp. TaxID=1872435 RepID=UPI0032716609